MLGAALLAAAAAAAVAVSGPRTPPPGGTPGLGRAVDLSRCAAAFDTREDGVCRLDTEPVPGLGAICPDHALPRPEGDR